jgi:hypothetical protein
VAEQAGSAASSAASTWSGRLHFSPTAWPLLGAERGIEEKILGKGEAQRGVETEAEERRPP